MDRWEMLGPSSHKPQTVKQWYISVHRTLTNMDHAMITLDVGLLQLQSCRTRTNLERE